MVSSCGRGFDSLQLHLRFAGNVQNCLRIYVELYKSYRYDFFAHDATRYAHFLMGKTYCFRLGDNPSNMVCALTISNDRFCIYDLPRSRRDYMKSLTRHENPLRRYPGVLIGRLSSSGVKSVNSDEGLGWKDGGFGSDEDDY